MRLVLVCVCALFFTPAMAETAGGKGAMERRVALVIGNSHYDTLPALANPANDVREVARVLREAGFDVTLGLDTSGVKLEAAVRSFLRSADGAHAGLIYYSGHGVQVGGQNFIVPVDASLETAYDIETQTMPLDLIVGHLRERTRIQLVFLDACRNNPLKSNSFWMAEKLEPVGATRGLARIDSNLGSLIAFSTAPGDVAADGAGLLSPYTQFFVEHAVAPNKEIRQVLTEVRRDVINATRGAQVPWENSSLLDAFYLFKAPEPPILVPMQQQVVTAGAAPAKLTVAAPKAPTGAALTITLEQIPLLGRILLDGHPVAAKASLSVDDLERLTFDAKDTAPGTLALFGYAATDPYGQRAQSVVAVMVVEDATAKHAEEARKAVERETTLAAYVESIDKITVAPVIGVGPVSLALPAPTATIAASTFTLREVPHEGMLRAGARSLSAEHVLTGAELAMLTYEPAIGSEDKPLTLTIVSGEEEATITVTPRLDACDQEAGAPLDLQGVVAGLLPNEIDAPKAMAACNEAVASYPGVSRFLYQLGRAKLAGRDANTSAAIFNKALSAGHARAGETLASLYMLGALGKRAPEKAVVLQERAAARGDPYGLYSYGKSLFYGRGTAPDRSRGLQMMIKAAELGHTYAMNELGGIFLNGDGMEADPGRAIRYFETGIQRKDIYSMNNLALVYRFGKGAPEDPVKALSLFREAADGGQPFAPTNLGRMYRDGIGTQKDLVEAAAWFALSAERGDYWGALDRARLALDEGGREALVLAARYLALADALQRLHGIDKPDKQAAKLLQGLPEAEKKSAEIFLRNALSVEEQKTVLAGAKSTEDRLRRLAGANWTKRNPRYDLF
jgi:TPR repeat protein